MTLPSKELICFEGQSKHGNRPLTLVEKKEFTITNQSASLFKVLSSFDTSVTIYGKEIIIEDFIEWSASKDLILISEGNITIRENAKIICSGSGSLYLKSGIEDNSKSGRVIFQNNDTTQVQLQGTGKVYIYYNPEDIAEQSIKYHNPYPYFKHIEPSDSVRSYMLINDVEDLQNVVSFLHGNYALSRNIDAIQTKEWNSGKGFKPLTLNLEEEVVPFSGNFDGNDFSITNLYINRGDEESVGLFGFVAGSKANKVDIANLKLENFIINGEDYVGGVAGNAEYAVFENIETLGTFHVTGKAMVGGIVGSASGIILKEINFNQNVNEVITATEYQGLYVGVVRDSFLHDSYELCSKLEGILHCSGFEANVIWET